MGLAALVAVLAGALPALATTQDMARLPISEPYRCLICHVGDPDHGGGTGLNHFGNDYLANLRRWSATLAALDSDHDGCANGVELGDSDGDGVADGNIERLASNPGAPDCGSSFDATTWGELKALFEDR